MTMIPELWKKERLRPEGRVTQKSIIAFWDNPIYPPRQMEGYEVDKERFHNASKEGIYQRV